jgi:serine/threonine protein kinase HipA of HipAB toxin-antitoxin module
VVSSHPFGLARAVVPKRGRSFTGNLAKHNAIWPEPQGHKPANARNSMVLPLPESSNDEHTFASRTPNKAPQKKRRLQEPNAEVSRQLGQVARVLVDEA